MRVQGCLGLQGTHAAACMPFAAGTTGEIDGGQAVEPKQTAAAAGGETFSPSTHIQHSPILASPHHSHT